MSRRKPKTGRSAAAPPFQPPASLIWDEVKCAALARHLFAFCEASFGRDVAEKMWKDASRKTRERSIKALNDNDLALVARFLGEQERDHDKAKASGRKPAGDRTIARTVAKSLKLEDARRLGIGTSEKDDKEDRHRAIIKAVLSRVRTYQEDEARQRRATQILDPVTAALNVGRLPEV